MEIKEIVESVLQQQKEKEAVILEIFMTGSSVFEINRNSDKDYVVICENYGQRRRRTVLTIDEVKYDILIIDKKAALATLDFNNNTYVDKGYDNKLYNYFYDVPFRKKVYGDSQIVWSVLEHKKEYFDFIKEKIRKNNFQVLKDPWKVGKCFVHYYTILKIFENNSVEMTEQMRLELSLLYEGKEESGPIIRWVLSTLLDEPETEVVEDVTPISEETIDLAPSVIITEPEPVVESSESSEQ
jgi:hypothetical protein